MGTVDVVVVGNTVVVVGVSVVVVVDVVVGGSVVVVVVDYLVVQDTHNLDTTDRKHGTFCTTRKQHSHQSHCHWERRH